MSGSLHAVYYGPVVIRFVLKLCANALRLLLLPLLVLSRLIGRPRGDFVWLRVRSQLTELPKPHPFASRFLPSVRQVLPTPLVIVRKLVDRVSADPDIRGVLVEVPHLNAGWAAVSGLRDALTVLRERGKAVVVFLPEGAGNKELFVASGASRALMQPEAPVTLLGLGLETRYVAPLLRRLGLGFEVHRRADFKTALEPYVRDEMSEPQREQLNALLESMDMTFREALAGRRNHTPVEIDTWFEDALIVAGDAVERGMIDGASHEDELALHAVPGETVRLVRAPAYLAFHETKWFVPLFPTSTIAVIELHGPIVDGPATPSRRTATAGDLVHALRKARADRRVAGVILHIDSPGGSALASDRIHREVVRLREKKPVVACLGDVAASGGYYVAVGADAIVAQPTTLTGSIGVIAAKLVAKELQSRFAIRSEVLRRAPHADMFSPARPLSEAEHDRLDRYVDATYRSFLRVVANGRGRPVEAIEPLAGGRVWTGRDAFERGLLDRLGGLDEAMDEIRRRLGRGPRVDRLEPSLYRPRRGKELLPAPPEGLPESLLPADFLEEALVLLKLTREPALCYAAGLPMVR